MKKTSVISNNKSLGTHDGLTKRLDNIDDQLQQVILDVLDTNFNLNLFSAITRSSLARDIFRGVYPLVSGRDIKMTMNGAPVMEPTITELKDPKIKSKEKQKDKELVDKIILPKKSVPVNKPGSGEDVKVSTGNKQKKLDKSVSNLINKSKKKNPKNIAKDLIKSRGLKSLKK